MSQPVAEAPELQVPPPLPGQMAADLGHLKLLSILHYVAAGLSALLLLPGLAYFTIGFLGYTGRLPPTDDDPVVFIAFLIIGGGMVALGALLGILHLVSGRHLARRQRRTFSLVASVIGCLWIPMGTLLGVFTILVLSRPSVKAMYQANERSHPGG